MSVHASKFPEVVRAMEAGYFREGAIEYLRAPCDSPREAASVATLRRQVSSLVDRPVPRLLLRKADGKKPIRFTAFGLWLLDALYDAHHEEVSW